MKEEVVPFIRMWCLQCQCARPVEITLLLESEDTPHPEEHRVFHCTICGFVLGGNWNYRKGAKLS